MRRTGGAGRRRGVRAGGLVAIGLGVTIAAASVVNAAAMAGTAQLVDPATNDALQGGGSATNWTFKLPSSAACSGDSATGAYFVYSYITPAANNPGSLTFDPTNGPSQPAGSFAYPLVDNSGTPYLSRNTAVNTGQVIDFPGVNFTFAAFSLTGTPALPAGQYDAGIACAKSGAVDKYWNTVVTFAVSGSDSNGEVWTQSSGPSSSTTSSTTASSTTTTTAVRATTTTTRTSTSSTTASSTTSTTAAHGTVAAAADPPAGGTAVLGTTATAPAAVTSLPRTGRSPAVPALVGLGLAYLGSMTLLLARRPRLRLP